MSKINQSLQVFRIYTSIFYPLYSLLHVANCFVRVGNSTIGGHVQLLHTSPEDTRCQSLFSCGPFFLTPLITRLISKRSHGQKSSDALVRFGKRIQLLPSPRKVHVTPMIPQQLNSMPTILQTEYCGRRII
jgi:hypothetical protein